MAGDGVRGLLSLNAITVFKVGDHIYVEFRRSDPAAAVVVWARDNLYGCRFEGRVSGASVSAATAFTGHNPSPAGSGKLSRQPNGPSNSRSRLRLQELSGHARADVHDNIGNTVQ